LAIDALSNAGKETAMSVSKCPFGNEYDPTRHESFEDTYEVFADLRKNCPVAHSDAFDGFWAFSRYADVLGALEDADNYITSVRNVVPGSSATGRRPPLHLNPPDHTPYRRAIDRALNFKRVAAIEPAIHRHTENLLRDFIALGEGDLVAHFGSPLPALVFGEWMGLRADQTQILWETGRAYVKAWESFDKDSVAKAAEGLAQMAAALIAERRASPRDPDSDPTSSLIIAKDAEGNPFPENLLAGCVRQVLVVGLVAPPIVIGSIAIHLSQDQALQSQLRARPELLDDALEEFLRLYTPYRGFARTVRREVELHGRTIKPNEPIALMYASANRDERIFEEPDVFKLRRPNIQSHLAFGRGPHRCAGMVLARLELKIALQKLLQMTSRFEVSGPIVMSGMPEVGPISVPLRINPA
jgi:cytochrome P450